MKYFTTVAALVSVIPGILSMTINTPTSVVQCQPQLLSWSDGQAPYYLTIIPGGQPSAAPLKSFDTQSSTSITWIVDLKAETQVSFALKDSTGATAYTDIVTIQPSNDSSCLGGSSDTKSSGNTGNSGNSGSAVTTQATDATSSVAAGGTTGSAAGTSRPAAAATPSGTSRPVTTQSPVSVSAQRTTSAVAAAGTSSSSTSSSNTSGAQSHFNTGGYLVAGALGLVGAIIL
ncbi:hypothetical protein CVT25_006075 [Psilocybe cyanescens]|uniref:Uncharacterized protein n=1 Tax=Psilocybe cyanescens TaxID=93625 RepID=A0A409VMQ4_PSICY|nr:hypothetical protein CVT25_006075 [Psilocybe cyanescens]